VIRIARPRGNVDLGGGYCGHRYFDQGDTMKPERTRYESPSARGAEGPSSQRARLRVLLFAAFALAVVGGCATYPPPTDRDLNAEAIKQMSYWGGEPGF
jgi:hypothetical protein